jgi:acyl-CoA thioesterase-1
MQNRIASPISFLLVTFLIMMNVHSSRAGLSYLALGDSYTIGEGVATSESWPYQLVKRLNAAGVSVQMPKVIARTGWRTDNLLAAIDSENLTEKFDMVSLLIGVNNQFQGKSIEVYKKDLRVLLNTAVGLCNKSKSGVFVVSIPDYGATPFGKIERESIAKEIDEWNLACKAICDEFEIPFFDITPISKQAATDNSLTAKDNLHPSAKMYSLWVDEILEPVVGILKD